MHWTLLAKLANLLSIPIDIPKQAASIAANVESTLRPCTAGTTTRLIHAEVLFGDGERQVVPMQGWQSERSDIPVQRVSNKADSAVVAGIDSTCVPIAETASGAIFAARVAVAFAYGGKIQGYVRYGPLALYLDEEAVFGLFEGCGNPGVARLLLTDRALAQRTIRIRLERAVAAQLASEMSEGALLIDGALMDSAVEAKGVTMRGIAARALGRGNHIVGLSKVTMISCLLKLSSILHQHAPPVFVELPETPDGTPKAAIGRVTVVRFEGDGIPLRADVLAPRDSGTSDSLSLVWSNDVFARGYPETLRMAHHLSVFSRHEAFCVGSQLAKNAGTTPVYAQDVRRSILGEIRIARSGDWRGRT